MNSKVSGLLTEPLDPILQREMVLPDLEANRGELRARRADVSCALSAPDAAFHELAQ